MDIKEAVKQANYDMAGEHFYTTIATHHLRILTEVSQSYLSCPKPREKVCGFYANSEGMRENNCQSVGGRLPCAYKNECDQALHSLTLAFLKNISVEELKKVLDKEHYHIINLNLAKVLHSKILGGK